MDQFVPTLLKELLGAQFQPADWMVERQRRLLEPLLRHARSHVPFYRRDGRLEVLFRADGAIDWARWKDVPPLTREELQVAGDQLRAEVTPADHGQVDRHVTSGSSGVPVTVWHTRRFNPGVRAAVNLRNFDRQGIDPSHRLAFLYPFTPDDFDIRSVRRHGTSIDRYSEIGLTGERFDIADTRPPDELMEKLIAVRPKFIRAQPVVLDMICAYDRAGRLADLGVSTVFGVGDHFSEEAKRRVSEHLGCWIVDSYGSVECGRMANSCPHCGRYHTEAETVVIEVVGDDGLATPVGEEGDVIVTPLYNYAMPLIRYHHDDRAVVGMVDACSVTLPALETVLGKKRTLFVFADGTTVAPVVPVAAVVELLGAQAFQVAQTDRDRCEFRIVPGNLRQAEMRLDEMTRLIRSMWWSGLQVDYRLVDAIPRASKRGKLSSYVQEMPSRQLPAHAAAVAAARDAI